MEDKEEIDYLIKKEDFPLESEYITHCKAVSINTLTSVLNRVGVTKQNLKDREFLHRYKVKVDTFLPKNSTSINKKLEVYSVYGIKLLEIETTEDYMRILVPRKEVDYTKSIGEPGSINYIPSTQSFINSFHPKSGYRK